MENFGTWKGRVTPKNAEGERVREKNKLKGNQYQLYKNTNIPKLALILTSPLFLDNN
jgi:hypothetical protein